MPKTLLSLTLVLAQFMASGVAPLYLCLDESGEVRVDLGPLACRGCDHAPVERDACCSEHHSCACSHKSAHLGGMLASIADACGCTHLQISATQEAVTVDRSADNADHQGVQLCLTALAAPAVVTLADHLGDAGLSLAAVAPCPAMALVTAAIMRC